MAAAKADYYEVLGVPRDAGENAIRNAFGAAAGEMGSDGPSSADAEDRHRALAEAYSVLSKPGSRVLYDRFGYRGRAHRALEEVRSEMRPTAVPGDAVRASVVLRGFEAEQGASRLVSYDAAVACGRCGSGDAPDPECPECGGNGTVRVERSLKVRIPAGVQDCAQLRVGGQGDASGDGRGAPGDLLIDVTVLPKPRDVRSVRYLALALLIAAIALLVAYLLFR